MQHRQGSNDSVHKQDIDMNRDDKKQDPMEDKSNVSVSRNRETHDDDDRDSKRKRLSSVATHQSKAQCAEVLTCIGIMSMVANLLRAREVQKSRQLQVEYLNRMKVVDRVPYLLVKHWTWQGAYQCQVDRWVDTLKISGTHRCRLVRSSAASPKSRASRTSQRHHFWNW